MTGPTSATVIDRQFRDASNAVIGFRCVKGGPPQRLIEIAQPIPPHLQPEPQPLRLTEDRVIFVPAGEFLFGNALPEDERESQSISLWLDDYYIDRYEVSTADYAAFLEVLGRDRFGCYYHDCYLPHGPNEPLAETISYLRNSERAAQPPWHGAYAYCQWRGGSLPTEQQWEKAMPPTRFESFYSTIEWMGDAWNKVYPQETAIQFSHLNPPSGSSAVTRANSSNPLRRGGNTDLDLVFRCVYHP